MEIDVKGKMEAEKGRRGVGCGGSEGRKKGEREGRVVGLDSGRVIIRNVKTT